MLELAVRNEGPLVAIAFIAPIAWKYFIFVLGVNFAWRFLGCMNQKVLIQMTLVRKFLVARLALK